MIWASASAWAQNADDEDLPADTKFFRKLFKEFGMQRDDEGVEYRERAPLVVPPSRSLPPPQSADARRAQSGMAEGSGRPAPQ